MQEPPNVGDPHRKSIGVPSGLHSQLPVQFSINRYHAAPSLAYWQVPHPSMLLVVVLVVVVVVVVVEHCGKQCPSTLNGPPQLV